MEAKKRIYGLLCVLLLVVICVAAWQVVQILLEYRAGEQTYAQLAELSVPRQEPEETAAGQRTSTRDFTALQAVNPDVLAWITVPNTGIDYPVVQGEDNQHYLNHLVTGEWNKSGSIFLDCQAAPDFSDPYSIIYGHNMLNGTMFSSLMDYKSQDFYDKHPVGVLETPHAQYEIVFFAGFVAHVEHAVWNTGLSAEELPIWAAEIQRQSWFQSSVVPSSEDTIIALATCSYEFNNARFVLLGILNETSDV
ncbi:SrtB family sortase [Flavonifractor sp. An112]|uniref:class B sortase n=1 Tax=Flavonifractor sp. An112 TaxID=1965544 RepID=UPI000B395FE2|nr:class B sortase [Flavonifractor sp. An112]OUQ58670.1 SrtB family sortase [Flavonifractor sp. An112]